MKKGQKVVLNKEDVLKKCEGRKNSTGESFVFENMDLNIEQVNCIVDGQEETIMCVDSDGDVRFLGLPGSYPAELFE